VGIFAGIHGDEPEAVLGLVDLVRGLNVRPEVRTRLSALHLPRVQPGRTRGWHSLLQVRCGFESRVLAGFCGAGGALARGGDPSPAV
jgi:hypothetical protein